MRPTKLRAAIVESASRFARDLIVQETGYAYLRDFGITLTAVAIHDAAGNRLSGIRLQLKLGYRCN